MASGCCCAPAQRQVRPAGMHTCMRHTRRWIHMAVQARTLLIRPAGPCASGAYAAAALSRLASAHPLLREAVLSTHPSNAPRCTPGKHGADDALPTILENGSSPAHDDDPLGAALAVAFRAGGRADEWVTRLRAARVDVVLLASLSALRTAHERPEARLHVPRRP